jgi:CDP-diacylglycerol---glycerol-3-phosphate 3-phosphatidyltransferase
VTSSFGPSALATPANGVTAVRVLLTPVLLVSILATGPSWPGLGLWVTLAATDGVDGYLARRQGATRSGAFLDPLADKVLVLGAMACLVVDGVFWWLPVTVIAVREVAMSLYRSWAGSRGVSLPARASAKVKTAVQALAVAVALAPPVGDDAPGLAAAVLWVAVVLTVSSGLQYLADARQGVPGRAL